MLGKETKETLDIPLQPSYNPHMGTETKPKRHYYRKLKKPDQALADVKAQVSTLTDAGLPQKDIAQIMGKSVESIRLYQREIERNAEPINTFKRQLSDALHTDLLLGMQIKHKLLVSLESDDISTLPLSEKRQLISILNTSNGITYDKIRLQDGKSTVNSSHRIQLESVHDTLYVDEGKGKQGRQVATTKGQSCGIMGHDGVDGSQLIDNMEITDSEA